MRGMRARASVGSRPSSPLAARHHARLGQHPHPRARRSPVRPAASSRRTTCGTWISPSCRSRRRQGLEAVHACRLSRCCIPTSVRRTTGSRSTWWTAHTRRARRLRLRRRERSRSVSVRARHPWGGRLRPAREHDRSGHMHALRAVRRGVERRRADGRERRDLPPGGRTRTTCGRRPGRQRDAAGLPIFPGLVRWDEVNAGAIEHAIRFTVNCTSRHYVWPARHQAGSSDDGCPPMGARFRLKAGFDMSHLQRRGEGHHRRHEALRPDRRRQRQRLVLPGRGQLPLDERPDGRAEVDPGGRSSRWTRPPARCRPSAAAFVYGRRCPPPRRRASRPGYCTRPSTASSFVWVSASSGGTTTPPYTPHVFMSDSFGATSA